MGVILPATRCDNIGGIMSAREGYQTQRRGFLFGLVMQAPCAWHIENCRLLEGKQVRHRPHCLKKQFRYSEPLLAGKDGNPPKIPVPRCQPGPRLTSRPFGGEQSQACCVNSFLPITYVTLFALNETRLTFLLRCLLVTLIAAKTGFTILVYSEL